MMESVRRSLAKGLLEMNIRGLRLSLDPHHEYGHSQVNHILIFSPEDQIIHIRIVGGREEPKEELCM